MNSLHVSLFGKLHIRQEQQPIAGLDARKVQELLCFLLVYKNRSHCREELATRLWGDKSTTHSKKYLRQALWQLQSTLNPEQGPSHPKILLVDPEWVHINPDADIWIDAVEFEAAFARTQSIPAVELNSERVQSLCAAVGLYQGDFLEGWYQDWCVYERERYRGIYLAMEEKLLEYYEAQDDLEAGMLHGLNILRCDRAQERTHCRLMRLYYRAGNRTSALRQFQSCVQALDEELGVGPAQSTLELYELIRTDRLDQPPTLSGNGAPSVQPSSIAANTPGPIAEPIPTSIPTGALPNGREHGELKKMQATLYLLKEQIDQYIAAFADKSKTSLQQ